jgi:hypothetical protein
VTAQSGWVVSIDDHPTVAIGGDDAVHNAIIVKVKQSVAGTNVKEASFDFLATAKSETRNDREAVRREKYHSALIQSLCISGKHDVEQQLRLTNHQYYVIALYRQVPSLPSHD